MGTNDILRECSSWLIFVLASIDSQLASMRISELRTKAHGKGVDVDGSWETLIAALKSAYGAELEAARAMPLPEYDDDHDDDDDDDLNDVDEE